MNFAFQSYPSHPWLTDWAFEPRGCTSSFRERNAEQFFQSHQTVGRIIPRAENPRWNLQVPVPQNSRTTILFNGFCASFESRNKKCSAEVFTPEPGVLWGRFDQIPRPVLLTDEPLEENDHYQWLENDANPALLMAEENTFCLITKSRILRDAEQLARKYLDKDIEQFLTSELDLRSGACAFFDQMTHHDSLAAISTESLMRSLRPAEGKIPLSWSQSEESETPHFNTNELLPLVMAWRIINPEIAQELVICALKLQVSSGAIPVSNAPHGTYSILEAPKPLIAKATELIWETNQDVGFVQEVVQPLRRHLQWLLHHFDPKKRGMHCWQNSSETMVPHLFETDLATADLTTLLLTEIDALNRLREHIPELQGTSPYFPDEREALEYNLRTHFWDSETSSFTKAFVREKVTEIQGFASYTPLLIRNLPTTYRGAILDRIKASDYLPGGLNILSWKTSSIENDSTALLRQTVILHALHSIDPHGSVMNDFARITLQGFVEWHTLAQEENATLNITPVVAAYILSVQHTHQYRFHAKGRVSGKINTAFRKLRVDRFDAAVVAVTLFSIIGIHTVYRTLRSAPPFGAIEARMNSQYTNRELKKCINSCMDIIQHYPEQAAEARLLAGNISLFFSRFDEAIELLKEVRNQHPDSPGAMISLGLAHQLNGQFKEAESNYAEFCYLFDQIFPGLVAQVNQYRLLMEEGFNTPPKWTEIYRYKLLHEL